MEPTYFHRVLKTARRSPARGFTLIEMLVVLAIIVIITAIALAGQSGFNRTSELNNTAYDIALSLRQAQSEGLSTYAANGNAPYGLYFIASQPNQYTLYADTDPVNNCSQTTAPPDCKIGNGYYTNADTIVQTYNLNNGYTVDAFCVSNGASTECTTGVLNALAVSYVRPNATITVSGKDTNGWTTTYTDACIRVSDSNGDHRYVSVSGTGLVQAGLVSIDAACSSMGQGGS